MKLHILTFITVAATLALAQRSPAADFAGTTTEFNRVNFSLMVETNNAVVSTSSGDKFTTRTAKIDNRALLSMFATWSGADTNSWRTNGAQLIFDWTTYQLAVADKSGSNILFYAGTGVNSGSIQAYCTLDWFNNFGSFDYGAFQESRSTSDPGTDTWNLTSEGFFELFYDDSSNTNSKVDVYGYGPNKEHYTQHWNQGGGYTEWTDTENFQPSGAAAKEVFNGVDHATLGGSITANGSGSGLNNYLYTGD